MSDSMKKAYKWLENITESKYLDCDKFGTFSIDKEKLVNDFKNYMGDKIVKYTEKTSGKQIKVLLDMLFPKTQFIENDFSFPYDSQCNVRIDDAIGVNELTCALEETKIDPRWIVITTDSWGHLTIVVCNYDGTDIDIED